MATMAGIYRNWMPKTGSFIQSQSFSSFLIDEEIREWTHFVWPKRDAENAAQEMNSVNDELGLSYIDRTEYEGTSNVGLPMSRVESGHSQEANQEQQPWIFA